MSVRRGSSVISKYVVTEKHDRTSITKFDRIDINVDHFGAVTAIVDLEIAIDSLRNDVLRLSIFGGKTVCENDNNAWNGRGFVYFNLIDIDQKEIGLPISIYVIFTGKRGNFQPVPSEDLILIGNERASVMRDINLDSIAGIRVAHTRFGEMIWWT